MFLLKASVFQSNTLLLKKKTISALETSLALVPYFMLYPCRNILILCKIFQ